MNTNLESPAQDPKRTASDGAECKVELQYQRPHIRQKSYYCMRFKIV